jgi:hypothetical protein
MSTTPVTQSSTSGTTSSGLPSSASLNNMFLQLLVAQLQNQDPLDPQDPSQFVGQLAQFSELSEVTSIYQLLQQETSGTSTTSSTGTGSSGDSSGGSTPSTAPILGTANPAATNPLAAPTSLTAPFGLGSIPTSSTPATTAFPNLSAPASAILNKILGGN